MIQHNEGFSRSETSKLEGLSPNKIRVTRSADDTQDAGSKDVARLDDFRFFGGRTMHLYSFYSSFGRSGIHSMQIIQLI